PARRGEGGRRPGEGQFMESPLSFFRMHWDHEPPLTRPPATPPIGWGEGRGEGTVHGEPPFVLRMHWDHEPPLTRPSATLSPSEGERDGVRGRFVERHGRTIFCPPRFQRDEHIAPHLQSVILTVFGFT